MKWPLRCASWLMPLVLTGCSYLPFHRTPPTQSAKLAPPIQPSLPVELASVELPPSEIVLAARPIYNMRERVQPIKPPARPRRQENKEEGNSEAANVEAPAIGQLSSGDPANLQQQTEQSIATIERGLSGINRTLNSDEQKTADQIREFLKQAKAALASGDVEGAHTLAAKAQVLLAGLIG